jgi:hypothetical protein
LGEAEAGAEMSIGYCHACGGEMDFIVKVGREDHCDHCGADLHCCKNCKWYEPGANNDCREDSNVYIPDREKSNFCHLFEYTKEKPKKQVSKDDIKSKLDALFKKK